MPSPPTACVWPTCVQHTLYTVARRDSQFVYTCVRFVIFCGLRFNHILMTCSHRHLTAPCSARALSQAHPTMLCIHLVTYILHVLCVRVKWPAHDSSNTPVMDIWVFPVFTQGELALLNLVLEQIPWSAILQSMCKCNMSQLSIIYQGHDWR